MFTNEEIRSIAAAFDLQGTYVGFAPVTTGYINNTLRLDYTENGAPKRYILQQINTNVFRDPETLMKNVTATTAFVYEKLGRQGRAENRCLVCFPTKTGGSYHTDDAGRVWRVYNHIEHARSYDLLTDPTLFYKTAKGFGEYANLLADFPMERLGETIPNFHHTAKRYETFLAAVDANKSGRAGTCAPEIAFVKARADVTHAITDLLENGSLPLRVTHNDTKLNNIMFDIDTNEPVCVVDLDTVMPGSCLYDFGDAIRSGAATAAEDEKDLTKVHVDLALYEAYVKGFLETAGNTLTAAEIDNLPLGAKVITLECGMRFLTDYLDGDVYFRTTYPTQNLDRCRTQFALVKDMEAKWDELRAIVERQR